MGRPTGFEPATPRITILCSNQLSYGRREERSGNFGGTPVAVNLIFQSFALRLFPDRLILSAHAPGPDCHVQYSPWPRSVAYPRHDESAAHPSYVA